MKKRFVMHAQQIGPEHALDSTFWADFMRTKLGSPGYGRKKAWVKLPEGETGWKARPGYGKLYYSHSHFVPSMASAVINPEASELLNRADTVRIGEAVPPSVSAGFIEAVVGYAWFAPDEGQARAYFTLRAEHADAVQEFITAEMNEDFEVHVYGDRTYVFPLYANGHEATEWMREMAEHPGYGDADRPTPADIEAYATAFDAFPVMARMRWA